MKLEADIDAFWETQAETAPEVDPEVMERLRTLGYAG